jgi:hypothetical protein
MNTRLIEKDGKPYIEYLPSAWRLEGECEALDFRVAAVIPLNLVDQGRFHEMVLEANRGNQFRVFQSREKAEQWLLELPGCRGGNFG